MTRIKIAVTAVTLVSGALLIPRGALAQIDASDPPVELGAPAPGPASPGPELVQPDAGLVPIPPEPAPRTDGAVAIPPTPEPAPMPVPTQLPAPTQSPRGYVGIVTQPVPAALAAHLRGKLYDAPGLLVVTVVPDSPASAAGLRPNDIVLSYDKTALSSFEQLVELVREDEPGQTVPLEIIRAGAAEKIDVTLGTAPLDIAQPARVSARQFVEPPLPVPGSGPILNPALEPTAVPIEPTVISNNDIAKFLADAPVPPHIQFAMANRAAYLMSNYRVVRLNYGIVGPGLYEGVATLVDRQGNRFDFQAGGTLGAIKAQLVGHLLQLP